MILVYQATNLVDGKTYIGITRKGLETRCKQHFWKAETNPVSYFHRAIAKHGRKAFQFQAIATCLSADVATAVERDLIADRKPEYNQTNGGEWTAGKRVGREVVERIKAANTGKRRTPEQNQAMSRIKREQFAQRPEYRAAVLESIRKAAASVDRAKQRAAASKSSSGRKWSEESRAKLSQSHKGIRHSPEVIARIAAKKCRAVECTTFATVFDSASEAAEMLGVHVASVCKVAKGQLPHVRCYKFIYVDQ